jgi:transposase-like protein
MTCGAVKGARCDTNLHVDDTLVAAAGNWCYLVRCHPLKLTLSPSAHAQAQEP